MQKNSTVNLHTIGEDIYIGTLAQESFQPTVDDLQASFFGGTPIWLHCPPKNLCVCNLCSSKLTFLGQFYCPFNADHCYHRILYILYCQKCQHKFKCIRQQATEQWKSDPKQLEEELKKNEIQIRILSHNAFEIENEKLSKKQLNKIIAKTKIELEEERAIQEAESDQQEDINEQIKMEMKNFEEEKGMTKSMSKEEKMEMGTNNQSKGEKQVDFVFEHYKKVMRQIQSPCMLYTNVSIPYNKQPIHPKHACAKCGSKLQLQIQITEQVLLMNDKECSERLLLMDWGSILFYTCSSSCKESNEEQLIIQYEIDPINEENIKKLKKKKKNKKRSQQKAKSKSKSKSRSKSKDKQEQIKEVGEVNEETGGDWD